MHPVVRTEFIFCFGIQGNNVRKSIEDNAGMMTPWGQNTEYWTFKNCFLIYYTSTWCGMGASFFFQLFLHGVRFGSPNWKTVSDRLNWPLVYHWPMAETCSYWFTTAKRHSCSVNLMNYWDGFEGVGHFWTMIFQFLYCAFQTRRASQRASNIITPDHHGLNSFLKPSPQLPGEYSLHQCANSKPVTRTISALTGTHLPLSGEKQL